MSDEDFERFLAAYRTGVGSVAAAEEAGVGLEVVVEAIRVNPTWKSRYRAARLFLREQAEAVLYDAAMNGTAGSTGDPAWAATYLRLKQEDDIGRVKAKSAKLQLTAQQQAIERATGSGNEPNFRLLDNEQFKRLSSIYAKMSAGEFLSPEEAQEYCQLYAVATSSHESLTGLPYDGGGDDEDE